MMVLDATLADSNTIVVFIIAIMSIVSSGAIMVIIVVIVATVLAVAFVQTSRCVVAIVIWGFNQGGYLSLRGSIQVRDKTPSLFRPEK